MYHLYNGKVDVKFTTLDFVEYADYLTENDVDVQEFSDEEMEKTLRTLLMIDELMDGEHTAEEFHTLATTGVMEGTELDLFAVKQMYGLYLYGTLTDSTVNFETMLDYMIASGANENVADMFDEKTVADLTLLSGGIKQFKAQMEMPLEIAIPTVFTSGLILTICGFVVGIISSQTSISTVGFLLGKGALVSVLMITLVLPSVLYLLDGFILKLSMKKKQ